MAAVHRLIGNHRNDLLAATITSTGVQSSADIRLVSTTQTGNATVTLTGPYTGAVDTVVEVDMVDTLADTVPRVSAPTFSGIGNGVLTLGAVTSGSAAQTLTVKLTDTGILTVNAALNFDEVVLQAKASGDAGNGIQISIDRTALVFTASDFSLLRDLEAGKDTLGPEYEWNTVAARSDGSIPDTAKRLTLGDDPTIYRQWKSYVDGRWRYHLYPALERAIPKGSPIRFVSGGRTVTVTQGATTETYTGIVTPYDLLAALQNDSNLIEVVGVVTPDQQPGGMAMREWRSRTDAHALPSSGEGSAYATGVTAISIGATAATELIQATCWAVANKDYPSATLGKEVWKVEGSVSGKMATHLRTGDPFTAADVAFTIPQKLPDGYDPGATNQRGSFRLQDIRYVGRTEDEGEPPPICAQPLVLGVAATDKTLTLVYTARPGDDCDCAKERPNGVLIPSCLGLDFIEGGTDVALAAEFQTRLASLYQWRATFMAANTALTSWAAQAAFHDLELADQITDAFASALEESYTIADARIAWDGYLTSMQSEVSALLALGSPLPDNAYVTGKTYNIGAVVLPPTFNGYRYTLTSITGTAKAVRYQAGYDFPYSYVSVGDVAGITLTRADDAPLWNESAAAAGPVLCQGGTTEQKYSHSHPDKIDQMTFPIEDLQWTWTGTALPAGDILNDASDGAIRQSVKDFVRRYAARMDYVRTLAGIVPKGSASTQGSGCWRDDEKEGFYWTVNGEAYFPAFTNQIYHSVTSCAGADGQTEVYSTREFAFALVVKCPEKLKEGDTVVLAIGDAGWPSTYQVGDVLTLPVIAAAPLELAGGVDGNDTLTWAVNSSAAGALPSYPVPLAAPVAYTSAAVAFTITPGAIAFAAGDAFTVAIEGGHVRWRRDGGSWSATVAVANSHNLGDGLTLGFASGPPPSLVDSDHWLWQVTQPYSPVSMVHPVINEGFEWPGADVTVRADFGAEQAIPAALIALHTLPLTATVTLAGSLDATTWWTQTLPVQAEPIVAFLTGKTARYLELRITAATGARIGWWWVGTPFQPSHNATTLTLSRVYGMARGGGLNPAALYRGQGRGGELAWSATDGGWLEAADMTELLALLNRCKTYGDEPFALCPNVAVPSETALVIANSDEVTFEDVLRFQDRNTTRYLSASIPLQAVIE